MIGFLKMFASGQPADPGGLFRKPSVILSVVQMSRFFKHQFLERVDHVQRAAWRQGIRIELFEHFAHRFGHAGGGCIDRFRR
ncbi:MAG: hypothetical protein ABF854_10225, partial [Gluconacetobacter sp.]